MAQRGTGEGHVEGEARPGSMGPRGEEGRGGLAGLALAALGVVYGDIGTSPLYAVRECFAGDLRPAPDAILGVLSLIFWSLTLVIGIKYLVVILRADNHGEGGVLALMSLALRGRGRGRLTGRQKLLLALGVFGTALIYGDGMITPAISVLGAIEGLHVATPGLSEYVVPIAAGILLGLFLLQRTGTSKVGRLFGPITLVWFLTLGGLGLYHLVQRPEVLAALSPTHAVALFAHHGGVAFTILGAVFLVVTGGEALYADLGHFGTRPIRATWYGLVMPSLVLNYFGQGALLLGSPAAVDNPFYRMAPPWALYPLLALATLATIIASQAVITGAFSLSRQAVMLGLWPRMRIRHTSAKHFGQIYVPTINGLLMVATLTLVAVFQSSSNLAAAYGIAVSSTMVIATGLLFVALQRHFGWSPWAAAALCVPFFAIDLTFFGANLLKIADGGWVPLAVAAVVFLTMTTWRWGRRRTRERLRERMPSWSRLRAPQDGGLVESPGTLVVLASSPGLAPPHLAALVQRLGILPERVVLVTVFTERIARVPRSERVEVERIDERFVEVRGHYGFFEQPCVPDLLEQARAEARLDIDTRDAAYLLGREVLLVSDRPGLAKWRQRLFRWMSRNAFRAYEFFGVPSERVLEVGTHVEL